MIGKNLSLLIKWVELRFLRKKIRAWHRLYKQTAASADGHTSHTSAWTVCGGDTVDTFDEVGHPEAYASTQACLDELIEVMASHPSKKTRGVSAYVDEHVYNKI